MNVRNLFASLAAVLLLASPALAQQMEERGQLAELVHFTIDPADMTAWEAAFAKIVEATHMAGLADEEQWFVSQVGNEYVLYYPVPDMAYFDDPMQFMRKYQGTAGESLLNEGFEEIEAIPHEVQLEIIEAVPGWAYEPADPAVTGEAMFAHVTSVWLKPGMDESFGELVDEFYAFFEEIGYRYAITGHRVRFGDIQRIDFVAPYADPGAYHGAESLISRIESTGMMERWAGMLERLNETISRIEEHDVVAKPEMSIPPTS